MFSGSSKQRRVRYARSRRLRPDGRGSHQLRHRLARAGVRHPPDGRRGLCRRGRRAALHHRARRRRLAHRPAHGRGRHLRHRRSSRWRTMAAAARRRSTASSSSTSRAPRTPASPWRATRCSTAGRWWSPAPSPIRSGRTASTIPTDGDWYLRSQVNAEPSPPGRAGAAAGAAAGPARGAALRGLSAGAARAQRPADHAGAGRQPLLDRRRRRWRADGEVDAALGRPGGGPPRLGAGRGRTGRPRSPTSSSATGPDYDMDVWKLQVGMDRPVHETGDGIAHRRADLQLRHRRHRRLLRLRRRRHRDRRLRLRRHPHLAAR